MNYEDRVTKEYIEAAIGGCAKIATGSYTGTGEYGAEHPNTLTFDFAPKLLLVTQGEKTYTKTNNQFVLFPFMLGTQYEYTPFVGGSAYANYAKKGSDGKTLYWYSTDSNFKAAYQYNSLGVAYSYLAIG